MKTNPKVIVIGGGISSATINGCVCDVLLNNIDNVVIEEYEPSDISVLFPVKNIPELSICKDESIEIKQNHKQPYKFHR